MGPTCCCFCPLHEGSGTPVPYFEVAGCKKTDCRDTKIVTHTIYSIRMHQNLKSAKNGQFLVKYCFFLASDKQ